MVAGSSCWVLVYYSIPLGKLVIGGWQLVKRRESEFPPTEELSEESGIGVPSYRRTKRRESEFPPTEELRIGNRSSLLQKN